MVWSGLFAPKYTVGYGLAARAMTADEILVMQAEQCRAMQNAYNPDTAWNWLYGLGMAPSKTQPTLEERGAKLAVRLDAAFKRFEKRYGYRPGSVHSPKP